MQSKKHSLVESVSQSIVGYLIGLLTATIVFPLFSVQTSMYDNIGITACFTVVSLMRSYVIRRWFDKHTDHSGSECPVTTGKHAIARRRVMHCRSGAE